MHYVSRLCWRGKKKDCARGTFITSCCYLTWQLIRWYILLDDASSPQGDSLISKVWTREVDVFTWTESYLGKLWETPVIKPQTGGAGEVRCIQVAYQSDSFVAATLNFHHYELSCDKNRRISRVRRCSWMFWCVTAGDAQARSLTRLASTQSQSIAQKARSKLFQVFSSAALWHVNAPQWEESEYILSASTPLVDKGRNYHQFGLQFRCFRSDDEMRWDTNADVNNDGFHFYLVVWIVLIKSIRFFFLNSFGSHWYH